MNKKLLLTIVLALILITGAIAFYVFNKGEEVSQQQNQIESPFGTVQTGSGVERKNETERFGSGTNQTISISNDNGTSLTKLVASPVAGFSFVGTGSSTAIRYAERGSGRIADVNLNSNQIVIPNISADTQSRIVSAYFFDQGKSVVRFREEDNGMLSGLYSILTSSSTSKILPGTILFFDSNITEDRSLVVMQNGTGATAYISNPDNSNQKVLWKGILQEINIQGLNKDVTVIETKPGINFSGALLSTDSNPKLILGGNNGFKTNVSSDGAFVVFSDYSNTNSPIQIFDKSLNKKWNLFVPTLPEKCVWSKNKLDFLFCFSFKAPQTNLPDEWYMGKRYLDSDSLWKISAKNEVKISAFDFASSPEKIDPTNIKLSKDETRIGFINKRDGSLWMIDLSKATLGF